MIFIGLSDTEKKTKIKEYSSANNIQKTIVISADSFPITIPGADHVKYSDVIMYVTFYRLLQEITPDTLIVINECLRTQNRYDLTYNCIRNFLNLTIHQLIFQYLPQIDTCDDFMILFDFDTRSRWKRRPFDAYLIQQEAKVFIKELPVSFNSISVLTSRKTKERYEKERQAMFRDIGARDPQIIPRNLYLLGGQDKQVYIDTNSLPIFGNSKLYVARNKRLKNIVTYADVQSDKNYTVVELPHRFIDFTDFMFRTKQTSFDVLVADIKVDNWYFNHYVEWSKRIRDTDTSFS